MNRSISDRGQAESRTARRRHRPDRPERPPRSRLVAVGCGDGRARVRLGPRQTQLDPPPEAGDLARRELTLRRHLQLAAMLDGRDEQALARLARHGRRAAVAPLEHRIPAREAQPAFRLVAAVALLALLGQERPDLLLEELGRAGVVRAGRRLAGDRQQQGGQPAPRSKAPPWSASQNGCARDGPPHPPFGHLLPAGEKGTVIAVAQGEARSETRERSPSPRRGEGRGEGGAARAQAICEAP